MLRQVAEGVLVHESAFLRSNAVVVRGRAGVLVVDPGVQDHELACLANDLSDAGLIPPDIVDRVPMDLLGDVTGLPAGTARIPWDGPEVRIIEHQAHAPGHAALLIEERGVLVAGDMLSDVLPPMPDRSGAADPVGDHLHALRLFEGVAGDVEVVVPGHGSVAGADELRARIARARASLAARRPSG